MTASVIACVNHKGGVGKTATVAGLAAAAADRGLRVLCVDMDPRPSLSSMLGVWADKHPEILNINDLIEASSPRSRGQARQAVITTSWMEEVEGAVPVDLIPGSSDLEAQAYNSQMGASRRLALALDSPGAGAPGVREDYDLVLIDCPPTLGPLATLALEASDAALLVTQPEALSVEGIDSLLSSLVAFKDDYEILGLVVNDIRAGVAEHARRLEALREHYPSLLWDETIPQRALIGEAAGAHRPLLAWRGSRGREVHACYEALLDRVIRAVEEAR